MTCIRCKHNTAYKFGTYGKRKIQRYRCNSCKATFADAPAKTLGSHYTDIDRAAKVFTLMLEGMSIRAISRTLEIDKNTVMALMVSAGEKAQALFDSRVRAIPTKYVQADEVWSFCHTKDARTRKDDPDEWGHSYLWVALDADRYVRNLRVRRLQCDEIWSFVGAKAKNVKPEKEPDGWGDVWTWTAIDGDTKLCVGYLVGGRDAGWANDFMEDCAGRINGRVQITTDGHKAYLQAVEGAFGCDVDFAQLQKIYGAPTDADQRRYSPAKCIGTDLKVVSGNPDPKHVSTSYVERQNLSMRMGMRRFTRLTNGFSKKLANHAHQIAVYFFHYNFCRVHKTLRVTPAMEAGLTDHVWTLEELCGLIPQENPIQRIDRELIRTALKRTA